LSVRIKGTLLYLRNGVSLGNFIVNRKILSGTAKERRAISPIIATLLLILIAIAAGVVVYAYVIGFVGNSTGNTGNNVSIISIDSFCASSSLGKCTSGNAFYIVVRNVGSTSVPSGTAQIYFTDITSGVTGSTTCTISSSVNPGSTYTCANAGSASWPAGTTAPSNGDTIDLKIVNPDSGAATSSVKVIN
jgi:archaeal type IV pilus assembly protein PilA